jgi:hypothetical protein
VELHHSEDTCCVTECQNDGLESSIGGELACGGDGVAGHDYAQVFVYRQTLAKAVLLNPDLVDRQFTGVVDIRADQGPGKSFSTS